MYPRDKDDRHVVRIHARLRRWHPSSVTLGKAARLLVALPSLDYRSVVLTASLGAGIGALMVAIGYRDGPAPFAKRPFSWSLAGDVLRDRRTRLAIGGYAGYM